MAELELFIYKKFQFNQISTIYVHKGAHYSKSEPFQMLNFMFLFRNWLGENKSSAHERLDALKNVREDIQRLEVFV